ncbi:DUF3325 family protein [Pseudocolwellia sp. AS88]|uniref:DUF3325 family protein n=1 Tax=Pseudocolwellia sp. AS88 TaxID=3063958 RepID=UPI0026ECC525|nr:DUF3325 family protein [Pseudocolwellia sp. AS88]MDO7085799.1 DUF3325 family protein [Pseudocolwellia sp. AS88]
MLVTLSLQTIALITLSLSMHKHFCACFGQPPSKLLSKILLATGVLLMCLSFKFVLNIGVISLVYWLNFLALQIVILAIIYCVKAQR